MPVPGNEAPATTISRAVCLLVYVKIVCVFMMKICHHTFPAVCTACNAFFLFLASKSIPSFPSHNTFYLVYGYIPGVPHLDLFLFIDLIFNLFIFRTQHVRDLAYHYRGFTWFFLPSYPLGWNRFILFPCNCFFSLLTVGDTGVGYSCCCCWLAWIEFAYVCMYV